MQALAFDYNNTITGLNIATNKVNNLNYFIDCVNDLDAKFEHPTKLQQGLIFDFCFNTESK